MTFERNSIDAGRLDWRKSHDGLLPAIVQDADSGRVLMLGYQDREALEETIRRGRVVFWSRRRAALWEKGETSGNVLELVSMSADCDGDTVLIKARPAGPVCHTGAPTCFDDVDTGPGFLAKLDRVIETRRSDSPGTSYTARLFNDGIQRIAQKVGEEGVETALAASAGDDEELRNEAADLVYHLLVLLRARGMSLDDVVRELARRHR